MYTRVCMRVGISFNLPNGNRELVATCTTSMREYLIHRKCAQGGGLLSCLRSQFTKTQYVRRRSAHSRFHYFEPTESGRRLRFARLRIQCTWNIRPTWRSLSFSFSFSSQERLFKPLGNLAFSFAHVNRETFVPLI